MAIRVSSNSPCCRTSILVTVNMIYGKGTQRSLKVYLEKDASENKVIVQSQQFSQEV